jgi:hypothetical protein
MGNAGSVMAERIDPKGPWARAPVVLPPLAAVWLTPDD